MTELVLIANAHDANIAAFILEVDAVPARLIPLAVSHFGAKTGAFAVDEKHNLCYVAVGGVTPAVVTCELDRSSGALTQIFRRDITDGLTYVSLTPDAKHLLGVSYGGGVGYVWPLKEGEVDEPTASIAYPNLHCIVPSADGSFVYAASLGADLIAQYQLTGEGKLVSLKSATVAAPSGSGPRHLVINQSGDAVYVMTEYSGEVIRFTRDVQTGGLAMAEAFCAIDETKGLRPSALGQDPLNAPLMWGADIQLSADGKWLFATERSASTIATIALTDDGRLKERIGLTSTEKQPRGLGVSSSGFVIAVGEQSNRASLYRIADDGHLSFCSQTPVGAGANWVRILHA